MIKKMAGHVWNDGILRAVHHISIDIEDRELSWKSLYASLSLPWKELRLQCRDASDRYTKGFSQTDVWSINSSILFALGNAMVEMSKHLHGAPPGYPEKGASLAMQMDTDFEQWEKDVRWAGESIIKVTDPDPWKMDSGSKEEYEEAKKAFQWIAEWYPHLWD